jgi:hypothetical protein
MKDRLKFKVGKITFDLKPLSILEQNEVSSHKKMKAGKETEDVVMTAFAYVKYAVKGISGVETYGGDSYKLEFDGDYLTDDCVSEIFNLSLGKEFFHAVQNLRYNIVETKMTYFGTKKPLKGVKLEIIPHGGPKS